MKRRWRFYSTRGGRRPVRDFLDALSVSDREAVAEAMAEVRAAGDRQAFRILFAPEGRRSQVLLALEGFSKKTRRTPPESIRLAERRLGDWRSRGLSRS